MSLPYFVFSDSDSIIILFPLNTCHYSLFFAVSWCAPPPWRKCLLRCTNKKRTSTGWSEAQSRSREWVTLHTVNEAGGARSTLPLVKKLTVRALLCLAFFVRLLRCVEKNMKKSFFLDQIGRTVVALCRSIPRGVLVFLPSYSLLRQVGLLWRASEVRGRVRVASTPRYFL